jgi:hypothetical protein
MRNDDEEWKRVPQAFIDHVEAQKRELEIDDAIGEYADKSSWTAGRFHNPDIVLALWRVRGAAWQKR